MKKLAIVLTVAAFIGLGIASTSSVSNANETNVISLTDTTKAKKACCTKGTATTGTKANCEKSKCTSTKSCCKGEKKK